MAKKRPARKTKSSKPEELPKMAIRWARWDSLHPNPKNARVHSERGQEIVGSSLLDFNLQSPIYVDKNQCIRKGNGTWKQVKAIHENDSIPEDVKKRFEIIPVIDVALEGPKLIAWEIADNKASDHSEFDSAVIKDHFKDLKAVSFDVTKTGFKKVEVGVLFRNDGPALSDITENAGKETESETGKPPNLSSGHQTIMITGPAAQIEFCRKVINEVKKTEKLKTQGAALQSILESFNNKK